MSRRYQAGFISAGYNPLRVPNAPTIGTASSSTGTTASVPFTAPSCVGGSAITGYTAVSSPGCKVGTAASSPITVSCLTTGTAYTFRVFATNSYGPSAYSASSNSVTPAAVGQQAYTTTGTYSWVAPAGVTSVSVVAVGPGGYGGGNSACKTGGGGGGGGLGYKNNISVTPGNSYTVRVGTVDGLGLSTGSSSYFSSTATVRGCFGKGVASLGCTTGGAGGSFVGDGGGNGGNGGNGLVFPTHGGGGGAGGYSGTGGTGGTVTSGSFPYGGTNGTAGSGGAGGGASWGNGCGSTASGAGGGVGILGSGSSGAGGSGVNSPGSPGSGGSGRTYGGGSSGIISSGQGSGAVRIIWPGTTRQFPSTCTGDK